MCFQDDQERAQQAFEIINKAWKTLEDEETRKKCMYIVEEAKERTDHMVSLCLLIQNVDSYALINYFYRWYVFLDRRKKKENEKRR